MSHKEKICSKCKSTFLSYKKHGAICRSCQNAYQKRRRDITGNIETRRYEKTAKGFLMRVYRNMKSRVEGIAPRGRDRYMGLPILDKEDFYVWSQTNPDFIALFAAWTVAGWPRKRTPSIDRIDSGKGYVLGNMRWLTLSQNSKNGGQQPKKKIRAIK